MAIEFAIFFGLYVVGNILFSHFEVETPKLKRLLKLAIFSAIMVLIYVTLGRPWSLVWLVLPIAAVIYIHAVWLPRHGINGLTGEPRDKYYELRGWKHTS